MSRGVFASAAALASTIAIIPLAVVAGQTPVVQPPDGTIPPMTPEGQQRGIVRAAPPAGGGDDTER
jgi:hypothetical protein